LCSVRPFSRDCERDGGATFVVPASFDRLGAGDGTVLDLPLSVDSVASSSILWLDLVLLKLEGGDSELYIDGMRGTGGACGLGDGDWRDGEGLVLECWLLDCETDLLDSSRLLFDLSPLTDLIAAGAHGSATLRVPPISSRSMTTVQLSI